MHFRKIPVKLKNIKSVLDYWKILLDVLPMYAHVGMCNYTEKYVLRMLHTCFYAKLLLSGPEKIHKLLFRTL